MENTHTIVFKEPVTFRVLRQACGWAQIDVDDLLKDPVGTLGGFSLPLSRAQGFFDVVLVDPPDLEEMPVAEAEAMAAVVCADFFSHICKEKWERQAGILRSYMTASAALHQGTVARA